MLKTLGKHVRGVMKESVLTPVFMIGEVIMEMIIPLLMASIINEGRASRFFSFAIRPR